MRHLRRLLTPLANTIDALTAPAHTPWLMIVDALFIGIFAYLRTKFDFAFGQGPLRRRDHRRRVVAARLGLVLPEAVDAVGADPAGRAGMTCPREGCPNRLHDNAQIVCTGDFHALAGMCRGKKRLGEPEAAMIEGRGRGVAYACPLCRQHHNGAPIHGRAELTAVARATVRALRADPRVGPQGILALVDAWAPPASDRSGWAEGLDQRLAYALP
jgi:hypothetical protein